MAINLAHLVADLDVKVGASCEFLLAGDLRDGRAQLVIRLDAVLRAVHEALQPWVSRWIGVVGTKLADECALGHFLEAQRGDDAVDVRLFVDDRRQVINLPGRLDQTVRVLRRVTHDPSHPAS
ncbi:hypothetical protein AU476_18115 [Cupriavidus sp. UYMSc13B]|nr:hypothetical protein AU476_18115 [Cupriavidus sp. UYMSc13B]